MRAVSARKEVHGRMLHVGDDGQTDEDFLSSRISAVSSVCCSRGGSCPSLSQLIDSTSPWSVRSGGSRCLRSAARSVHSSPRLTYHASHPLVAVPVAALAAVDGLVYSVSPRRMVLLSVTVALLVSPLRRRISSPG